jgi:FkbM family methyltransferase
MKRRKKKVATVAGEDMSLTSKGRESFSQCGEDLVVDCLFAAMGITKGSYLDIGASHPSEMNNTLFFYKRGWRGANIDPLPETIALFRAARPDDVNIQAGIGAESGIKNFYWMHPATLSTFNKLTAETYSTQGHLLKSVIEVQVLSASDLVARYNIPPDLDLLSIDIEGDELDIVTTLVAAGVRPKIIVCETALYSPILAEACKNIETITTIKQLGYMAYADTYINTIFVDPRLISSERPNTIDIVEKAPPVQNVDVVITVRDDARFLPACLDSVLAQTYAINEVIVIDEGSTDRTPAVISGYARRYPNVRAIRTEPLGVSHARNIGIQASDAELIAFIDSNDVWKADKIARQVALFERSRAVGFVHSLYFWVDESGGLLEGVEYAPIKRGDVFQDLLDGYQVAGSASAVVARRDLLLRVGGFDDSLACFEDSDMWLKLAKISQVDCVPDALVGIRAHTATAQSRPARRKIEDDLLARLRILEKWLDMVEPGSPLLSNYRTQAAAIGLAQFMSGFGFRFYARMRERAPGVVGLMFADARDYRAAVRSAARTWLAENVILRSVILLRLCQMFGKLNGCEVVRR